VQYSVVPRRIVIEYRSHRAQNDQAQANMNTESPSGTARREVYRLISGSAFIYSCRLVGAVLTFITQILMARWMGASELGVYVLAFSWCILLSTLSTGGFRLASIRFIGEGLAGAGSGYISGFVIRSRQIAVATSLAVAIIGCLGLLTFGSAFDQGSLTVFAIAFLAVPFFTVLNLYSGFANALSRFPLSFIPISVFRPLLFLAAICGIWLAGKPLDATIAMSLNWIALALVTVVTVIIGNHVMTAQTAGAEPQFETRKWLRTSLPLLFVVLFTGYFPALMMIILGPWLPSDQLAIFHVCLRVAMLITFGLTAIDAFTGPELSSLLASGKHNELHQVVNRITRLRFWAALAAAVILGFAGREVLGLFGEEFTPGYPILMILALAQLVQASVGPVTRLISLSGHQDQTILVFAVALIVAVALVIILVPLFGIRGAAIATLLDTALWVFWMRYLVIRRLNIRPTIF
jgi:O-antigen/teichoic acid export membrane protein